MLGWGFHTFEQHVVKIKLPPSCTGMKEEEEGAGKAPAEVGSSGWQCCVGFSHHCFLQSIMFSSGPGSWHLVALRLCETDLGKHLWCRLCLTDNSHRMSTVPFLELVWLKTLPLTVLADFFCSTIYRSSPNIFEILLVEESSSASVLCISLISAWPRFLMGNNLCS